MRPINRRLHLSEPACCSEVVAVPGVTWGALEKALLLEGGFFFKCQPEQQSRALQGEGWALVKEPGVPPLG